MKANSDEHSMKLLRKWKFWVIFCKIDANNNPQYQIEPIKTVARIDLFCDCFMNLPKVSELKYNPSNRVSIGFFDELIRPAWEDEGNKNGGMFTFLIDSLKNRDLIDEIWLNLLIDAARGKFDLILKGGKDGAKDLSVHDKFITGIVIVLRSSSMYKIEIWTKNNYSNKIAHLSNLQDYLAKSLNKIAPNEKIPVSLQFRAHNKK